MVPGGHGHDQWMKEERDMKQEKPLLRTAALFVTPVCTIHDPVTLCILFPEADVIATLKGPIGARNA